MKVLGKNLETGEEFITESDDLDNKFIQSMSIFDMAEDKTKKIIDGLDISADAKSMLFSFSKVTIRAGETIIKIGRKIIDYICNVFTEFPSTSFGLLFGAIAGFLIASIPIIGVVLGPLFGPIAMILGLVGGLGEDLKDRALIRRVSEINAKFNPLTTVPT